eukprot:g4928.t1
MHILLVRHGETKGNVRAARLAIRIARGEFASLHEANEYRKAERLELSEEEAQGDTYLSARGGVQASWLAKYWAPILLEKAIEGDVEMYVSPMRRCLQTAKPLVDALGLKQVNVDARIFEVPGLCHSKDQRDIMESLVLPLLRSGKAEEATRAVRKHIFKRCGLSRRDILRKYPFVTRFCGGMEEDVSARWWRGGFESERETAARIEVVKQWLLEQAKRSFAKNKVIVLVSHGDTIWRLTKALMGISQESVTHSLQNTSVTCLGITPDGKISCKFVNRCAHLLQAPGDRQSRQYYKFQNIMKQSVKKGEQKDLNAFYIRTTQRFRSLLAKL